MNYISEQIADATKRLGIDATLLSLKESHSIREKIAEVYGLDAKYLLAYTDRRRDSESICDEDAWQWIALFVRRDEVFLLIDHGDDPETWRVIPGEEVVTLLGETTGFVFYISNRNADYLLHYDDHDCLTGLGTAVPWLRRLRRSREV